MSRQFPHSAMIYDSTNIHKANSKYDIFITGSDQVWPGYSNAFTLAFAGDTKIRISYAASIARKEILESHAHGLATVLPYYSAISVRDKTDKDIVCKLTDKKVN